MVMVHRIAEAEQRLAGFTPEHVHPARVDQPLEGTVNGRQPDGTAETGVEVLGRERLWGFAEGIEHGRALPGDARRLGNSAVGHGPQVYNPAVPAVHPGAYRRYARVYDLVWRAAPYDRFVDLCLEAAAAQGTDVRRVLVAACGTGAAAVELARRGYEVTGFDLSLEMLAVAAAKPWPADTAGARRLVAGDLRAVPLAGGWADLVVCLNASINYLLEPAEVVAALAHLGRTAAPGGTVVVEPLSPRFVHEGWEPGRHLDRGGLRLDASYELDGDLVVERLRWSLGGAEEAETYRQRLYDDTQLEGLFGAAGLELAGRRPMWPAIPDQPARGRTLWVARPPG
jgi:SAM-dependent methyltransferase